MRSASDAGGFRQAEIVGQHSGKHRLFAEMRRDHVITRSSANSNNTYVSFHAMPWVLVDEDDMKGVTAFRDP